MKLKSLIALVATTICAAYMLTSCNKTDYPDGLPEYDNYYYVGYLPWNNTAITVNKTQTTPLKFPVEFHSSFTRNYDAVAHFKLDATGLPADSLAVVGKDFNIVDKDGNALKALGDSVYTITFPQAKYAVDTIYVKMLNNTAAVGKRYININLTLNKTDQYTVGTFSDAYKRPLKIQ